MFSESYGQQLSNFDFQSIPDLHFHQSHYGRKVWNISPLISKRARVGCRMWYKADGNATEIHILCCCCLLLHWINGATFDDIYPPGDDDFVHVAVNNNDDDDTENKACVGDTCSVRVKLVTLMWWRWFRSISENWRSTLLDDDCVGGNCLIETFVENNNYYNKIIPSLLYRLCCSSPPSKIVGWLSAICISYKVARCLLHNIFLCLCI